ncbi:dienelactone hydrolase family protein [Castellaniella sp. GW247-6E4]|uniref:dienelactone hydrolase family protein n=1 Tax=Castellaniella sp. GW247-6E4 TaxID=3140380 RepID=UPI00331582BE
MSDITLTASDGHTLDAYITGPEDARAGVVVLQEIFGINANIRHMTDMFASHGYRAICPAMFDRVQPKAELGYDAADLDQGLALRNRIPESAALLDIQAAAAALPAHSARMIVGYCWGGTLAWLAACRDDTFAAASCWYGGGIAKALGGTPGCPVQMHFGEDDPSIPMRDVEAIGRAHPEVDLYTYRHAGHAFGRAGTPAHHAASAALAWDRTLKLFAAAAGSPSA